MASDTKKGSRLWRAFTWAVKATVSIAFGFAVLGALDFTLFHNLAEGEYFMKSIEPYATAFLRADIFAGSSIADGFVALGDMFGGPAETIIHETQFAEDLASAATVLEGTPRLF